MRRVDAKQSAIALPITRFPVARLLNGMPKDAHAVDKEVYKMQQEPTINLMNEERIRNIAKEEVEPLAQRFDALERKIDALDEKFDKRFEQVFKSLNIIIGMIKQDNS